MTTSSIGAQFTISSIPRSVGPVKAKTTFNQFDEFGLLGTLPRLKGETNWEYRRRIQDRFVHLSNSSYRGLVNGITRDLGLNLFNPININPRVDGNGDFVASDPLVKFDGVWLLLYSDYANGILDWAIDRFEPGGNYEHLGRLVEFVNTTTFFEAGLTAGTDYYTRSMTVINQSNEIDVPFEDVPASNRFQLENPKVVPGTVFFSNRTTFRREVATEGLVTNAGDYWINYPQGIVVSASIPAYASTVRYKYRAYPFTPDASPVILHDINNNNFRVKMFSQVLQPDGTTAHGLPTEIGVDIVNELLSVYNSLWGV